MRGAEARAPEQWDAKCRLGAADPALRVPFTAMGGATGGRSTAKSGRPPGNIAALPRGIITDRIGA